MANKNLADELNKSNNRSDAYVDKNKTDSDDDLFEKVAEEEYPRSQTSGFSPEKIAASERASRLDAMPETPGYLAVKAGTPKNEPKE